MFLLLIKNETRGGLVESGSHFCIVFKQLLTSLHGYKTGFGFCLCMSEKLKDFAALFHVMTQKREIFRDRSLKYRGFADKTNYLMISRHNSS